MEKKSRLDGLTKRQRGLVRFRLAHPEWPLWKVAKLSGYRGSERTLSQAATQALRRPRMQAALLDPPPTADPQIDFVSATPQQQREWLMRWYVRVVECETTPQSERIRALNAVAEMVPGAKVPVAMSHSGTWNLQQFVEAAGGRPSELPDEVRN